MITVLNAETNPFFNQAFEEYVFTHFTGDEIFLIWRNSPAVVVGSYQNICREVHVRALMEKNIPVVRRMTGGGTDCAQCRSAFRGARAGEGKISKLGMDVGKNACV